MVNSEDFSASDSETNNLKMLKQAGSTVSITLPADLVQIVQQRCHQSGQSAAEVIVTLLRAGLTQTAAPIPSTSVSTATHLSASSSTSQAEGDAVKPDTKLSDLALLQARLSQLESVLPRLEQLEGKLIAF